MKLFAMNRRHLSLQVSAVVLLIAVPGALAAQDSTIGDNPFRVSVMTGGLTSRSAVIVAASGGGDTRLGAGPAFGVDLQYQVFSKGSLYGGGSVAFSTLHHGTNLGVIVRGAASDAIVYAGTAGLVLDWMSGAFRPIVRLGGGLKGYSFSTEGAEGIITPTGDFGLGFRAGTGAVELGAEFRYLPSVFDQAKLPTRGIVAQDQQQTDFLFGISVTVRP
jgi:hypothetical protein